MLASACDHGLYSTDEHFDSHARQARQSTQPVMFAYQHDDPMMYQQDQPAAEKAALWRSFYAERFPMIGAELATAGPMVAEGVDLLPDSIASVAASARAVWLLPTRSFWEPRHFSREYVEAEYTADAAERGWAYYAAMIDHHHERCTVLGQYVIEVDGSVTAEQIATTLTTHFGL
tara:strand:- start:553 stop:1077 length:525 start_codon:yes stop_codon:yes gene_type:complete